MKPKKYSLKVDNKTKSHIFFNPYKPERDEMEDIKVILDDQFDVVENHTDNYKQLLNYIIRLVSKSKFLCKGLNASYIKKSFRKADMVIVLGDSSSVLPNGNIFGLALVNLNDDNSLYISIFCSHTGIYGAGEILMKEIEKICQCLFIAKVHLESVKSAITFYEKYGFVKHDEDCDDMCEMTKVIPPKSPRTSPRSSPRTSKSPRTSPKTLKSPRTSPKTSKSPRKSSSKTLKK